MATENQSGPPPDAGGVSRRTLLKAGAGAATVGAITTRPGPLEDVEISPVGEADAAIGVATVALASVMAGGVVASGALYGAKVKDYREMLADVQKDQVEAHASAYDEMDEYGFQILEWENTLADSMTQAHINARDAVADAWEAGKSASEAQSDAYAEIDDYYAERVEHNLWVRTAKSLSQIARALYNGSEAVIASGEYDYNSSNPWCGPIVEHPTYGTRSWSMLLDQSEPIEVSLRNGSTVEIALPDFKIEWDSSDVSDGDYETTVNTYDFLEGHIDDTIDLTATIDGENASWNGGINIPNVPDADLAGYQVMQLRDDFVRIRSMIDDQAQQVKDGYYLSLVEDIYYALDQGWITPNDLRGIDGLAQELAGTEDASADAYILALTSMLDRVQPDLSKLASMSAGYNGFTGRSVITDDSGTRNIYPGKYAEAATYEGLLFAESVPSSGLDAGARYVCDPTVLAGTAGNNFLGVDTSGNELWSDGQGGVVKAIEVGPAGRTVFVSAGPDLYAIDMDSMSQKWSVTGYPEDVEALAAGRDGQYLYVAEGDSTRKLDATDGTEQWIYEGFTTDNQVYDLCLSPDGSSLYAACSEMTTSSDGKVVSLATSDGTENWNYTTYESNKGVATAPDGSAVYAAVGQNVVSLSPSDGTENWSVSLSDYPSNIEVTPDGTGLIVTIASTVKRLDSDDGTEEWSVSISNAVKDLIFSPDGSVYVATQGGVTTLDPSDGTQGWSLSKSNYVMSITIPYNPVIRPDLSVAGTISGAYFYDASSSTEHKLMSGLLKIESMTDQDGNNIDTTDTSDWGSPDYDQDNMESWSDYWYKVQDFRDTFRDWYEQGDTSLFTSSSDDGGWWPPDFWPSWLPSDPIGAAIVVLLGIAGFNVATS
ncbi:outer membrane protein assembly factor BamB family protein [Halapricum hydrolyticum]|uniref:PQQ-like beta-propeller repeat protein n=1 Tax=Halapricum hydrolyticum TaxID=2979991 RepID=A0AAE3I8F9_9EURY|nr:PQQ-binding-like beta-propeller repeat protein [Halapricum hydrolyticum]MCU4716809.1 PQQ-like beta-propeller repeat protein [Halapricum hydrolyticum]MCU4725586.1 PQQ-like beta-propeller repeat protein [Halapricum hydrolyticum]